MIPTEMDGFIGSAVAAESILDATTILHGPGGCRIHLSRLSSRYVKREFNTREGSYFFHFDRVPCTYIDSDDYIYGAARKVSMVLDILEQDDTKFATIIQSPGASLIGDKLKDEVIGKGLDDTTLVLDTSFMSRDFSEGYDTTMTRIVSKLTAPGEKMKGTANIIGLPFTSRGYYRFLRELRSVLGVMGIEVIAAVGTSCTLDEIRKSAHAEYNICIMPEYCRNLADYYEKELGIPTVVCPMGAPIGFRAMESFVRAIGDSFDKSPERILPILEDEMEDLRITLRASLDVGEKLRYKTFSISGESSVVYPLCDFMIGYLRMVPLSIVLTEKDPVFEKKIQDLLRQVDCLPALSTEFAASYTNVLFGPGSYVKLLQAQGRCGIGVDISLPSQDMIDYSPKSIMGLEGFRIMLDGLLNSR